MVGLNRKLFDGHTYLTDEVADLLQHEYAALLIMVQVGEYSVHSTLMSHSTLLRHRHALTT